VFVLSLHSDHKVEELGLSFQSWINNSYYISPFSLFRIITIELLRILHIPAQTSPIERRSSHALVPFSISLIPNKTFLWKFAFQFRPWVAATSQMCRDTTNRAKHTFTIRTKSQTQRGQILRLKGQVMAIFQRAGFFF